MRKIIRPIGRARSAAATVAVCLGASGALLFAGAAAGASPRESSQKHEIVSASIAGQDVVVQEMAGPAGALTLRVENRSSRPIRDVRLAIQNAFRWHDEYKPGPASDNPSRTDLYTLDRTIAPGASVTFDYQPAQPLPSRSDGSFATPQVEVLSYTQEG